MDQTNVEDVENEIKSLKEKLKTTETKLDSIINLVYQTFIGDSKAAEDLSKIVGAPPPVLYCDDEIPPDKRIPRANESVGPPVNRQSVDRFTNRLEFLNQVMSDHDRMMLGSYGRSVMTAGKSRQNRAKSAERISNKTEQTYFNPYTWNLSEHMNSLYRHRVSSPMASCTVKPLVNRLLKSRAESRQNNSNEVKVEDIFNHSINRRSLRPNNTSNDSTNHDFRLGLENEVNPSRPPRATRPVSSLSYNRNSSAKTRKKIRNLSSYNNLNLQSMEDSNNKTDELLKAMEKRFELSTIDLQRRLGISKAGMVGP